MKIFEPHAHMISRVTDDYERMALAGVAAVLEPAFWVGQPRTHVGTFLDYFDSLLGWERYRAAQYGIHHFCAIALNPKEANDDRVNDGVMVELPRYLEKDGVLAVGEIGYDDMTEREERYFTAQLHRVPDGARAGRPQQRGDRHAVRRHRLLDRLLHLSRYQDG
jgi:predicted metal-dependent TIM-barrel fold hydrolase